MAIKWFRINLNIVIFSFNKNSIYFVFKETNFVVSLRILKLTFFQNEYKVYCFFNANKAKSLIRVFYFYFNKRGTSNVKLKSMVFITTSNKNM